MKHLQKGLTLLLSPELINDKSRITLNSGIINAKETIQPIIRYCKNAHIPKYDWRGASIDELNLITSNNTPSKSGEWAGIVRIPDKIVSGFWEINSISEVKIISKQPTFKTAIQDIVQYLMEYHFSDNKYVEVHSLVSNPPGLQTVTYNPKSGCYIGMHLDSFDKKTYPDTKYARNRICVNLGREPRYFIFYNLSLTSMFELLKKLNKDITTNLKETDFSRGIGFSFMKHFPNYPIIKVKINPKEAYIAPTENVFHDGSTFGNEKNDIQLTLRGYFEIQKGDLNDKPNSN